MVAPALRVQVTTKRVYALGALAAVLFGYDGGIIGAAILFIPRDLPLSPWQQGVVVGGTIFGAMLVASDPGATSCGSSDTASPVVSTLPASASRSVSGLIVRLTSADAATVIERAAATWTGAATTSDPSVSPRLDSVRSSSSAMPGAVCPAAASAAVDRAPVNRTASHGRNPSASSTSGCSRTTPRRASTAEVLSRAVSVICGALTTSEPTARQLRPG